MAVRYGFYNSINHDRKYDALDMSSIFDGIIEDGVFATIGNIFAVTPGEGLQVVVDTGKAWFNHTWTSNDAPIPLGLDTPDITLARYDAVVLEVNNEQNVRANSIKIVKGTAASDPQKPELLQTGTVKQHVLAYVKVLPGSTSVAANNIEIQVGKDSCPFVTGPLETVPIDTLFARWESEFDLWFENLKTNLEGDVVANLQRQIDGLQTDISTPEIINLLNIPSESSLDDVFLAINTIIQMISKNQAKVNLTVTDNTGEPLSGIIIRGLVGIDSGVVKTDELGKASGSVSEGSATISVSDYGDIEDFQESFEASKGKTYEKKFVLNRRNFLKVDSTRTLMFTDNVARVDVTVVGAGGGGGSSANTIASSGASAAQGAGGGGGYCTVQESVSFDSFTPYSAVVGAGGAGGAASGTGNNGGNGGKSSFLSVTAKGGTGGEHGSSNRTGEPKGGAGNGKGGDGYTTGNTGNPGENGSTLGYSSFSATVRYGGGGGGAVYYGQDSQNGGRDYGGKGGSNGAAGRPGTDGYGGGGGGGSITSKSGIRKGGKGGNGCIAIRMHLIKI